MLILDLQTNPHRFRWSRYPFSVFFPNHAKTVIRLCSVYFVQNIEVPSHYFMHCMLNLSSVTVKVSAVLKRSVVAVARSQFPTLVAGDFPTRDRVFLSLESEK